MRQIRLESLMKALGDLLLSTAKETWPDKNPEIMGRGIVIDGSPVQYPSVVEFQGETVWITTDIGIWQFNPFFSDESTIEETIAPE